MMAAKINGNNGVVIDESLTRGRAILEDAEKYLSFFEECFGVTSSLIDDSKKNPKEDCDVASSCKIPLQASNFDALLGSPRELKREITCTSTNLSCNKYCDTSNLLTIDADNEGKSEISNRNTMNIKKDIKESEKFLLEKIDEENDEEVSNAIAYLRDVRLGACKSFFNHESVSKEKILNLVQKGESLNRGTTRDTIDYKNQHFLKHGKFCYYEETSHRKGVHKKETKKILNKVFDPNKELEVLKRASKRAAKRAEVEAICNAEAKEIGKFKALPLPNGVSVENNPYALTKSALNRQQKINDKEMSDVEHKSRRGPKLNLRKMSKKSDDVMKQIFFKCNFEEPHLELNRPVKFYLNNEAMDTVDCIEYINDMGEFDLCSLNDLHQKNGKLHAVLTEKRRQCQDLHRLITHEASLIRTIKAYSLFDHDKNHLVCFDAKTNDQEKNNHKQVTGLECVEEKSDKKSIDDIHRRHEKWRLDKQTKIDHARNQQIKDSLAHVTGQPQITSSKNSWKKAKMEHDSALKPTATMNLREDNALTMINQVEENKEEKQLFLLTKKKENEHRKRHRTVKRTIKKQKGALEKLAQPRLNCSTDKLKSTVKSASKTEIEEEYEGAENNEEKEKQNVYKETKDESKNYTPQLGFDNMNDKQFSNVLKSMGLGKMVMKRKNNGNNTCKNALANVVVNNITDKTLYSKNHKTLVSIPSSYEERSTQVTGRSKLKLSRNLADENNHFPPKDTTADRDTFTRSQKSGSTTTNISIIKKEANGSTSKPKKIQDSNISCAEIENSGSFSSPSLTSVMRDTIHRYNDSKKKLEPYEMYESGKCTTFFDKNSSTLDKGRFRVRDARYFAPESMRRKSDPECSNNRIMFLVGKQLANLSTNDNVDDEGDITKEDDDVENAAKVEEQVITIIFDRLSFSEKEALDWWNDNRTRFV